MAILNRSFLLVMAGFVAGATTFAAGFVFASPGAAAVEPSNHAYLVSIDEIRSNLVPGQAFSRELTRKVTMSDGSSREVTLRPVRRGGQELVELTDVSDKGSSHSYMGPNGTTTDGTLMISVKDIAELEAIMRKPQTSKQ
ncbi:hypothetical protein [Dyella sp. 20L07]|uniref:hypothetical protein n=1 Tax=Dyella sp. 20L07 TaxID=3384240 RepID=UPI003D295285